MGNQKSPIWFSTPSCAVSTTGQQFLESPSPALVPSETSSVSGKKTASSQEKSTDSDSPTTKLTRKSKGTNLLPLLQKLLASQIYWYQINKESDHQFPSSFPSEYPQRLGYCEDITALQCYTSADENFFFSNIQLGKGKPCNARKVTFEVDRTQEELWYRIAPCGGIKSCSNEECTFTTSTREHLCPKHPSMPQKAVE